MISKNYRDNCDGSSEEKEQKRFDIEVLSNATGDELKAAESGTVVGGDVTFEVDGRRTTTSVEAIRGEMRTRFDNLRRNAEERGRDLARFSACRNRYSKLQPMI